MQLDTHDLPLSTGSAEAAERYRNGVRLILATWPGADVELDLAIAADPDFAMAHAARARVHALSAQPRQAHERVAAARSLAARNGTEREQSHIEVLNLAFSGRSAEALSAALAHAERWPRDVLVLAMPLGAFGLFAFSGMADHDQARVDLCARHAGHFADDDWWFLTSHGWSLAENGAVARGRAMIERAFALHSANANTVHALAHAMFEGGAGDEAEAMITGWLPSYDRAGVLHGHLAWHAALVALERGDAATALGIYEAQVRPGVSQGLPINIVSDVASFLWRLDLYGHGAPQAGWDQIASYARDAFPRPGHAFVDAHLALIEAATDGRKALDRRIASLEAGQGGVALAEVVPAIGRAASAFAQADYDACIRTLEPVAAAVVRIGGSGAQREVIEDTLLVALMRAGATQKAQALLERRLHRRPSPRDAAWLAAL
ncbi:tetratricopeptide repeat protein [Phenylobacterium sp. LjRoot164]|uniref:tetratricopeptide repeat protein n=1 Tax=unclassified Phenylobacterium TaxID=2640670 RepID=UPI003ECDA003